MIRVKNHHTPPTIRPDRDLQKRERGGVIKVQKRQKERRRGEESGNGQDQEEDENKKGEKDVIGKGRRDAGGGASCKGNVIKVSSSGKGEAK